MPRYEFYVRMTKHCTLDLMGKINRLMAQRFAKQTQGELPTIVSQTEP